MYSRSPFFRRFRALRRTSGFVLMLAFLWGCAHPMAITSDPPGQPVFFNDEDVGETPVLVEEHTPYAMHRVQVGEGPDAVTRVVGANRLFARTGMSAALMSSAGALRVLGFIPAGGLTSLQVVLPATALLVLPGMFTAGTVDRVHVATSLSGEPLGPLDGAAVELEYLPAERRYPAGVQVDSRIVEGKRVRVMVERRRFALSLNYLGFHFQETLFGPSPRLSAGAELEWLPSPRWSVGGGAARVSTHYFPADNGGASANPSAIEYRENRWSLFGRYRLPLLRWDGVIGGLDAPFTVGGDAVRRRLSRNDVSVDDLVFQPYIEGGLDAQFTSAVVLFSALRYYPPLYGGNHTPAIDVGRVTVGMRFLF